MTTKNYGTPATALSAMSNDELLAGLEAKYQEYQELLPLVKELQEEVAVRKREQMRVVK